MPLGVTGIDGFPPIVTVGVGRRDSSPDSESQLSGTTDLSLLRVLSAAAIYIVKLLTKQRNAFKSKGKPNI
jgi:hypothetical protein